MKIIESHIMNALEAIRARRAVKHFDPNHEITADEEAQIHELLRCSPTSFNMQNWRFLTIKDKELRKQMREAAWGQAQIEEASLLYVICADLHAWKDRPERYWQDAPKDVADYLVGAMEPFYGHKKWQQRDEAMRSVGIAAQTLMIAAKAMGYDSCPMIGFDELKVAELTNLPENYVIGMIVTVGKAVKPAQNKGGYIPDEDVFFEDRF